MARAAEVAETVAGYSPASLRTGLMFVQDLRERGWRNADEIARMVRKDVFESDDFREGVTAFRAKRKPIWPSIGNPPDKV
jgi:enoyl-CoA hydratase/carnithine racemase